MGIASGALLLTMGTAAAQEVDATPAATASAGTVEAPAAPIIVRSAVETQCELHVYPAERFNSMSTGLLGGGLIDAALHADKDKSNRTQMASALDPAGQIAALQSMDLINLLKLQPANIIFHPTALERETVGKVKTRRAESQSPCYSELIMLDVLYQKAAIYGRSLRTLIWFRDFGSSQNKSVNYRGLGGNGLELFPAKEGEDVQAANAELVDVFKLNLTEYAANAIRSRKSKK
jgi:hypothetical protein